MAIALWQQPAPVEEKIPEVYVPLTEKEAAKTATDTRAQFDFQGYCIWVAVLVS